MAILDKGEHIEFEVWSQRSSIHKSGKSERASYDFDLEISDVANAITIDTDKEFPRSGRLEIIRASREDDRDDCGYVSYFDAMSASFDMGASPATYYVVIKLPEGQFETFQRMLITQKVQTLKLKTAGFQGDRSSILDRELKVEFFKLNLVPHSHLKLNDPFVGENDRFLDDDDPFFEQQYFKDIDNSKLQEVAAPRKKATSTQRASVKGSPEDDESERKHRIAKLREELRNAHRILGQCEARGDHVSAGMERGKAESIESELRELGA